MASDGAVFIAGRSHPAHVTPPMEGFPRGADFSSASIVERLAAPDVANIEFEAPQSGGSFERPTSPDLHP